MPDTPDDGSGPNIGGQQSGSTRAPVPDPTVLTTQALYREVSGLKELLELRIEATTQEYRRRLQDLDKSVLSAIESRNVLDLEVQKRTDLQFVLVEQQRVEQKADTKNAVDAALTAQKEAIAKAETGTTKQIEQLQETFKTEIAGLRRSIDENKDRLVDTDRKASGIIAEKTGSLDTRTLVLGLIAAAGVVYAIISSRG